MLGFYRIYLTFFINGNTTWFPQWKSQFTFHALSTILGTYFSAWREKEMAWKQCILSCSCIKFTLNLFKVAARYSYNTKEQCKSILSILFFWVSSWNSLFLFPSVFQLSLLRWLGLSYREHNSDKINQVLSRP